MNKLYQQKHQLWLRMLFGSFAINDPIIKSKLYDFSQILFRHLKWLGRDILENGGDYNYDRDMQLYKTTQVFEVLEQIKQELEAISKHYDDSTLFERIKSDEAYMLSYINDLLSDETNNKEVTAFSMKREWEYPLDQESIDALTLFLFEESYKEYELIMVYAYMQARTKDITQFDVYQDLIDESHFHLKSFGEMMAKLGILALPRELHELTYKITDLDKFLKDGIAEEEAAKEMCKELSDAVKDERLSAFFDFINNQESYHIDLMKRLLDGK